MKLEHCLKLSIPFSESWKTSTKQLELKGIEPRAQEVTESLHYVSRL